MLQTSQGINATQPFSFALFTKRKPNGGTDVSNINQNYPTGHSSHNYANASL